MQIILDKFCKAFGDITVIEDLDLIIEDGEMIALLGPSGCGKTTTLFAVCGIHQVSGGRILFGGRDVSALPPQERNVGVVFQSYALYPHLTVYENIAFPLRIRKEKGKELDRKVREIAELVHIDGLLDRRPAQLSGGQQQRVALARALVRRPDVLLLDEPLANLDAKLRLEMRSEIRRIQKETGITAILVTHDQVEAMSMCDRIAIMDKGRIQQIATPSAMYDDPANRFVAGFLGNPPISFLRGVVRNGRFALPSAAITLPLPGRAAVRDGQEVEIGIRPEFLQPDYGSDLVGRIAFVETQGRENLYDIALADGSVVRSIQPVRNDLRLGEAVAWGVRAERILAFDISGRRL